jgi:hypothetical protein
VEGNNHKAKAEQKGNTKQTYGHSLLAEKEITFTSVDVDRSFPAYKFVLGEKRHKSESENIEASCNLLCC